MKSKVANSTLVRTLLFVKYVEMGLPELMSLNAFVNLQKSFSQKRIKDMYAQMKSLYVKLMNLKRFVLNVVIKKVEESAVRLDKLQVLIIYQKMIVLLKLLVVSLT